MFQKTCKNILLLKTGLKLIQNQIERKYFKRNDQATLRHGPFDIRGGGGGWIFFEKNFLALILTKKNNIAQWHSEKNNLSRIV